MEITYLGHSSFRLKASKGIVLTDPFDPDMVGLKFPKVSADLVTVSHQHEDHNRVNLVAEVKKEISGPGEYEVQGISFIGIPTYHDNEKGEKRGKNTIFVIEMDNLRILHLGDLGHDLTDEVYESVGSIDILFIPVGGFYTIDSSVACEIVKNLENPITIPMHFQAEGLNPETFAKLEGVEAFLSQIGLPVERLEKLIIKKEEIIEEQKVIVLERKI